MKHEEMCEGPPAPEPKTWSGVAGETRGAARLARRISVVHLLVILTLIPALGLPVFSWTFVQDRVGRSRVASRVAQGLDGVGHIDVLRAAVESEAYGLTIKGMVAAFKATPEQQRTLPPEMLESTPESLRTATDQALRDLQADPLVAVPGGRGQIAQLARQLRMIRAVTTVGGMTPQLALVKLVGAMRSYSAVVTTLQEMERSASSRISGGRLGAGSAAVLDKVAQIQVIVQLIVQTSIQRGYLVTLVGGNADGVTGLTNATGTVETLLGSAGAQLSGALAAKLTAIRTDPGIVAYRQSVQVAIDGAREGSAASFAITDKSLDDVFRSTGGATTLNQQMSDLLAVAVRQGVDQARQDKESAADRARNGLLGTVLALGGTACMLLFIGGLIRRRLRDLARSAQLLSAGQLELMPVQWPREVALASTGLNDAVHGLREISVKAGLIAQGDLASPALEHPSPGQLGAALHASFERVVAVMRDRETLQQQLAHDASHDGLTGLANRGEAERQIRAAIGAAREHGSQVALLFIDLDHFKAVNDTYGHQAGDHVLCEATRRMSAQIRDTDVMCRLGGDEFVVILRDVSADVAAATGQRIIAAVREPIAYHGDLLQIGASAGIAVWPEVPVGRDFPELAEGVEWSDEQLAEDLLLRADQAVYRAKAAGRNTALF